MITLQVKFYFYKKKSYYRINFWQQYENEKSNQQFKIKNLNFDKQNTKNLEDEYNNQKAKEKQKQKTLNENQEEKIRIEIKKYKKTINFNYK